MTKAPASYCKMEYEFHDYPESLSKTSRYHTMQNLILHTYPSDLKYYFSKSPHLKYTSGLRSQTVCTDRHILQKLYPRFFPRQRDDIVIVGIFFTMPRVKKYN